MRFITSVFPKYLVEIDKKIIIYIKQVFTVLNIIVDMLLKSMVEQKPLKTCYRFIIIWL